jgi:hypothetical protein
MAMDYFDDSVDLKIIPDTSLTGDRAKGRPPTW